MVTTFGILVGGVIYSILILTYFAGKTLSEVEEKHEETKPIYQQFTQFEND